MINWILFLLPVIVLILNFLYMALRFYVQWLFDNKSDKGYFWLPEWIDEFTGRIIGYGEGIRPASLYVIATGIVGVFCVAIKVDNPTCSILNWNPLWLHTPALFWVGSYALRYLIRLQKIVFKALKNLHTHKSTEHELVEIIKPDWR